MTSDRNLLFGALAMQAGLITADQFAMVLINPQGRIVLVNRQTERIFEYSQAELVGQPVEVLVPQRYRAQHASHVASFFATATVRPMGAGLPLRGCPKNGEKFAVDIALSPIDIEYTRLVAASVRDVSDRK
jgi:PAS domain S-box-containing protein